LKKSGDTEASNPTGTVFFNKKNPFFCDKTIKIPSGGETVCGQTTIFDTDA
jgi:hypothetical protein